MWRRVVWYDFTDVSEEFTASIFSVEEFAKRQDERDGTPLLLSECSCLYRYTAVVMKFNWMEA
jgi:hypothetical protein